MRGVTAAFGLACVVVLGSSLGAGSARAQKADDEESQLLVDEARAKVGKKQYDAAGRLLDQALKINPRRLDAYILRASVHAVKKQYDQGVAVMRRAYALAPDNANVLTALGTQLVLNKNFGEGIPMLEKVASRWPDRYDAHVVLGHVYVKLGEWEWAITAFDHYFKTRPSSLAGEDVTHLVDHANAHLRAGHPDKARQIYQRVLKQDPKNVLGRLGLAWAAAATDCNAAMPILRDMNDLADKYPAVLMVEGRCAIMLGRAREALAIALSYNTRLPNAADGWALLGEAKLATGDNKGALAALNEAVKRDPDNKVYAFRLARVERAAGNSKAAAERLKVAGPPDGFEDDWTLELGEALLDDERPSEVKEVLSIFVETKPEVAQGRVLLGLALYELDDAAGAVPHLEKAVQLEPKSTRARGPLIASLNMVALSAFQRGDLQTAEQYLVRADQIGDSTLTWRNLGAVRLKAGKAEAAIDPLQKAAKTNDGAAYHLLGRAYQAQGKLDEARDALRRALTLLSSDPARSVEVRIDFAAVALSTNDAGDAVTILEPALSVKDEALQERVEVAYYTAARAASTAYMRVGAFERAYRLLDDLEKRMKKEDAKVSLAVRCDLALAATGAGYRDVALSRLRKLESDKAICPFAEPADELAVPILIAWNEGADMNRAERALGRLDGLRKRATGPARPLVRDAARYIALRAAAESWSKGRVAKAKAFVVKASKIDSDSKSAELAVDHAVFALDDGRIDAAISELERYANQVPEALVHLGIAYEKRGNQTKALELYRRAQNAGVRHAPLKRWIQVKERIWGAGEVSP